MKLQRSSYLPFLTNVPVLVGAALVAAALTLVAVNSGAIPFSEKPDHYYVTTLAGSGVKAFKDGPAAEAAFNWPTGVTVSSDGTVFVADYANHVIRKIKDGVVSTIAGGGKPGYRDGPAGQGLLWGPDNIAIDNEENIIIGDADNFRIRKLSTDGVLSTVAGSGHYGLLDGRATVAMFGYPTGVAVDGSGNIYVADRRANAVRKVTTEGVVITIGGNGTGGYADGKGIGSHFREPIALVAAKDGTLFVADSGNNAIRKIETDGTITTLAGGAGVGYRDGSGKEALFSWPTGIAIGPRGDLFVCDSVNNRIRRVTMKGVVSTVAGGTLPGSKDGEGWKALFNFPTGIWVDKAGVIYVADSGSNRIRVIRRASSREARVDPLSLGAPPAPSAPPPRPPAG